MSVHDLEISINNTVSRIYQLESDQKTLETQLNEQNVTIQTLQEELEKRDELLESLLAARDSAVQEIYTKSTELSRLTQQLETERSHKKLKEIELQSVYERFNTDVSFLKSQIEHYSQEKSNSEKELRQIQLETNSILSLQQKANFEAKIQELQFQKSLLEQAKQAAAKNLESSVLQLTTQFETAIKDKQLAEAQILALKTEHQNALLGYQQQFSSTVQELSTQLSTVRAALHAAKNDSLKLSTTYSSKVVELEERLQTAQQTKQSLELSLKTIQGKFETQVLQLQSQLADSELKLKQNQGTIAQLQHNLQTALKQETALQALVSKTTSQQASLKKELTQANERFKRAYKLVVETLAQSASVESKNKTLSSLLAAEKEKLQVTNQVLSSVRLENAQLKFSLQDLVAQVESRSKELEKVIVLVAQQKQQASHNLNHKNSLYLNNNGHFNFTSRQSNELQQNMKKTMTISTQTDDLQQQQQLYNHQISNHFTTEEKNEEKKEEEEQERLSEDAIQIPAEEVAHLKSYLNWLETQNKQKSLKVKNLNKYILQQKQLVSELSSVSTHLCTVLESSEQEKHAILKQLELVASENETLVLEKSMLELQLEESDALELSSHSVVQSEENEQQEEQVEQIHEQEEEQEQEQKQEQEQEEKEKQEEQIQEQAQQHLQNNIFTDAESFTASFNNTDDNNTSSRSDYNNNQVSNSLFTLDIIDDHSSRQQESSLYSIAIDEHGSVELKTNSILAHQPPQQPQLYELEEEQVSEQKQDLAANKDDLSEKSHFIVSEDYHNMNSVISDEINDSRNNYSTSISDNKRVNINDSDNDNVNDNVNDNNNDNNNDSYVNNLLENNDNNESSFIAFDLVLNTTKDISSNPNNDLNILPPFTGGSDSAVLTYSAAAESKPQLVDKSTSTSIPNSPAKNSTAMAQSGQYQQYQQQQQQQQNSSSNALLEKLNLLLKKQAKLANAINSLSVKEQILDQYLNDSLALEAYNGSGFNNNNNNNNNNNSDYYNHSNASFDGSDISQYFYTTTSNYSNTSTDSGVYIPSAADYVTDKDKNINKLV